MQTLDVRNPGQVGSRREIFSDLADGRTLAVLSGIAFTNWEIDTDEVQTGETHVHLGVFASKMDQWSVFVGLASIANDETGFVFAVDSATVDFVPGGSGELKLVFKPRLMGEPSALHRVAYQVVLTIARVKPYIAGTISWPRPYFLPPNNDVSHVADQFEIVANIFEPPTDGLGLPKLTPVTRGRVVKLDLGPNNCVAHYRIEEPPMISQLQVKVRFGPKFTIAAPNRLVIAQIVPPPEVFKLTVSAPSVDNINFSIGEHLVR